MNCQDIREDLDLSALGTLEPQEELRLRSHAATCDTCRAALQGAEHVAAALGRAVPRVPAPASMRERVMAAVRADRAASAPNRGGLGTRSTWVRRLQGRYGAVAAAAAVAIILPVGGLVAWASMLQRQVNTLRQDTAQMQRRDDGLLLFSVPSSVKADFQPSADARGATGAVTWNPNRNVCFVVFDKLPKAEHGTTYRLWYVVDNGRRVVDAGTLTPDDHGRFDLIMDVSNWRAQEYDMVLRLESQPRDPAAPVVLTAKLRRPD
jgi:hypothetical protein